MHKIAFVIVGLGMSVVALGPSQAATSGWNEGPPGYSRRYGFAGAPQFTPAAPVLMVPYSQPYSHGGCFVPNNNIEEVKGVRHWQPAC